MQTPGESHGTWTIPTIESKAHTTSTPDLGHSCPTEPIFNWLVYQPILRYNCLFVNLVAFLKIKFWNYAKHTGLKLDFSVWVIWPDFIFQAHLLSLFLSILYLEYLELLACLWVGHTGSWLSALVQLPSLLPYPSLKSHILQISNYKESPGDATYSMVTIADISVLYIWKLLRE